MSRATQPPRWPRGAKWCGGSQIRCGNSTAWPGCWPPRPRPATEMETRRLNLPSAPRAHRPPPADRSADPGRRLRGGRPLPRRNQDGRGGIGLASQFEGRVRAARDPARHRLVSRGDAAARAVPVSACDRRRNECRLSLRERASLSRSERRQCDTLLIRRSLLT